MTKEEFIIQTQRLVELYEKPLNEQQINLWFDNLRAFDVSAYKQAIDECFARYKFMPSLTEMSAILRDIRNSPSNEVKRIACKVCNGSGYILYNKIIGGINYQYACQCPCTNGERVAYDGRSCQRPSDYYLEKAENVFHMSTKEILKGVFKNNEVKRAELPGSVTI